MSDDVRPDTPPTDNEAPQPIDADSVNDQQQEA